MLSSEFSQTEADGIHAPTIAEMSLVIGALGEHSLSENAVSITTHGQELSFMRLLGEGGTKTVIEVSDGEDTRAVALPNVVKSAEVAADRWAKVLMEPENTDTLREIGLVVNPICEPVQIEIEGYPLSTIATVPYESLGFEVRDGKKYNASNTGEAFLPSDLDAENVIETFALMLEDAAVLIKHGIRLNMNDSISVCKIDGDLRLFLHDLSDMGFRDPAELDADAQARIIRSYVMAIVGTVGNVLDMEEWEEQRELFESEAMSFYPSEGSSIQAMQAVLSEAVAR